MNNNTIIWITGASSGIGEALVYELSKNTNAKLIISARRTEALEKVKNNASRSNEIEILPLDLAQMDEKAKGIVEKAISFFGKIDILINNGGISQRSLAKDTLIDVDKRLMQVNYIGTVTLSKTLLPHFIQNRKGHFVVTTSLVGIFASPYRSSYSASKHALHGFFDTLRAEHHDDNIKVTLVCPGFVQTNVSKNALTGDGTKQNTMDAATQNGISAQKCAKGIVSAIKKQKAEVYIGGKEILAVYLKRYFPGIFRWLIRRAKVK